MTTAPYKTIFTVFFAILFLAGCEYGVDRGQLLSRDGWSNGGQPRYSNDKVPEGEESIFGEGGIFGDKKESGTGSGVTVNAYLWRATLDTISFMPLQSADPFGGVVLTDWHSSAAAPNERFKLNVYILGQALRADGIRVAAFRQMRSLANEWQSVEMDPKAITDIENAILTRARQLRSESIATE